MWNQLNQLHTPIDNLRVRSSFLADCFIKVAGALESYGTRPSSILSSVSITHENTHVQNTTLIHTTLAAEYKQLLEQIRGLPDFHGFLQPPNTADLLSSIPSDGPVIIFNVDESRCDALALISGINKPLHIPLENLSLAAAEQLQSMLQSNLLKQREIENGGRAGGPRPFSMFPFMEFILKELWVKIVHPVLEALGLVGSISH